jgi:hypothetical protein
MRPFAIGLAAALAVAILTPAVVISAQKEEKGKPAAIDAKKRELGMKEAPAVILASGATCTVSDARYIGEGEVDAKTDAAPKDVKADPKAKPVKEKVKYYEVACAEGMGFAMIAKPSGPPLVYNCLEASQPGPDGKVGGLACILPGNTDPVKALTPIVAKAGLTCEPENGRALGASLTNTFFEVACKGGTGFVLQTSNPVSTAKDVVPIPCINFDEGSKVNCKLTDRATQMQVVDTLNKTANNQCAVKDKRYMLTTKTDNYFEVACQDGKGYVYQQTVTTGAFVRAIPCLQAKTIADGCLLSDTLAAETAANALYTKLAKNAGFPCDVEKYGMLPSNDPKKEIVELRCKGGDVGGIGVFTATTGVVYDCLTAEFNGFRCTFTKLTNQYARMTQDLVGFNKASCKVSDARVLGSNPTEGYVEVACSDGLPGWVLSYPAGVAKPAAKEFLSCAQAKGIAGGCKLPTNKTKG